MINNNNKTIAKNAAITEIPDNQLCMVYKCNHIIDIVSVEKHSNSLSNYKPISSSYYCDSNTGEVFPYNKQENRLKTLGHTFIKLRRLINNNFVGRFSEIMLTLTYSSPMTDTLRLYQDFRKFWSCFRYHYPKTDYISIIEIQENFSFHLHVLVKTNDGSLLFVPKSQVDTFWMHGSTYINRIANIDNLGAYLCSYFAYANKPKNIDDSENTPSLKMLQKSSRLKYYPPNLRIYRYSKGIKQPKPFKLSFGEVKKLVKGKEPVNQTTKCIVQISPDGTEEILNNITYQQYNLRRNNNDEKI